MGNSMHLEPKKIGWFFISIEKGVHRANFSLNFQHLNVYLNNQPFL
jgi:hypothetical protein